MARALQLARRGLYTTDPNPCVGCVLVKDETRIAEGWHRRAGEAHAEIMALNRAGTKASGATCYLSLEPCCHQGRTGACTDALIEAGITRVIAAMSDPNPLVSGEGSQVLRQAGITVDTGLLESQARRLNAGFCSRMERGRPYVVSKLGASLDGRTALASGESKWITSPAARNDVQRLRAQSSAVMTGIGTVLADNPSLTVRDPAIDMAGRQPLRVVIDSRLRMPPDAAMFDLPGNTCVITVKDQPVEAKEFASRGVEVIGVPELNGVVDLKAALDHLAQSEINDVLLEAGPTLSGAMMEAGLVDELVLYVAPMLLGDSARPLCRLPGIDRLDDSLRLETIDIRALGPDWRIRAKIVQRT